MLYNLNTKINLITMKEKILFQISKEDKNLIKTYAKQMRISLSAYIRYKLFQS